MRVKQIKAIGISECWIFLYIWIHLRLKQHLILVIFKCSILYLNVFKISTLQNIIKVTILIGIDKYDYLLLDKKIIIMFS